MIGLGEIGRGVTHPVNPSDKCWMGVCGFCGCEGSFIGTGLLVEELLKNRKRCSRIKVYSLQITETCRLFDAYSMTSQTIVF